MSLDLSQLKQITIDGTELIRFSIGQYNNVVPTSIDTDGSIFNGCGYINGYRLSSSGALKEQENTITTGFIPYIQNSIITIYGASVLERTNTSSTYHYICFYDKNFTKLCHFQIAFGANGYSLNSSGTPSINTNNSIINVDTSGIIKTSIALAFNASTSNIAYCRINACSATSLAVSIGMENINTFSWNRKYKNLVPLSIDTDGSIFNGCGYINNYTIKDVSPATGFSLIQQNNTVTTGYIPATKIDTIKISGVSWIPSGNSYYSICFFDENFAYKAGFFHRGTQISDRNVSGVWEIGDFVQDNDSVHNNVTIDSNGIISYNIMVNSSHNFAYIRISAGGVGENMIVIKNEEII